MSEIHIVGMGMGNPKLLTVEASGVITESSILIGDARLLENYKNTDKELYPATRAAQVVDIINNLSVSARIAVLVSGDVGFYSLTKSLLALLPRKATLHCGINSLQYFAAKLQTSWQDACLLSLHGRDNNFIHKVKQQAKVFMLTGGTHSVRKICTQLTALGLGDLRVSVGERLSYEDERITTDTAHNLSQQDFAALSVMMVFNEHPTMNSTVTHGLADECFTRGKAPMTKQEVRAVSLSKLELCATDTVYDIGAGTGSVSIEAALQAVGGTVYAVERDEESTELIKENIRKFQVGNVQLIKAYAPEGLTDLPAPDKVFVGGSGGKLHEILDVVYGKNCSAQVVLNCITLESLGECVEYYKRKKEYQVEFVHIAVGKSKKVGSYNMMMGQNPIYIITAKRVVQDGN